MADEVTPEKLVRPTKKEVAPEALVDIPNVRLVQKEELLSAVQECKTAGMRFVTATCFDRGDQFEILYHFDANLELHHIQVNVDKDEELTSITGIYLAAFLTENEMKELFGLKILDIAIDYHGYLLIAEGSRPTPMIKSPEELGPATKTTVPKSATIKKPVAKALPEIT